MANLKTKSFRRDLEPVRFIMISVGTGYRGEAKYPDLSEPKKAPGTWEPPKIFVSTCSAEKKWVLAATDQISNRELY